jgi:hypothetical protein
LVAFLTLSLMLPAVASRRAPRAMKKRVKQARAGAHARGTGPGSYIGALQAAVDDPKDMPPHAALLGCVCG